MASTARHDALLDLRRSAPSDLPQRWEGGRAGASCDPSAAATRLKAVVELYGVFKEIAGEALGGRKCHSHFEQWLWACRVDLIVSGAICAPVLTAAPPAAAQAELARKLERAGVEPAKARDSCARLAAACARDEWLADTREKGVVTLETVPPTARARHSPLVRLVCDGVAVECSEAHLEKLRALHAAASAAAGARKRKRAKHGGGAPAAASGGASFEARAFCVLARIHALQGGESRAGGMQAACGPAAFDALRADFGVAMEVFASPINARYGRFCSAAADVDGAFGSVGSFFALTFVRGAYLANPPFLPAIVEAMAARMDAQLRAADAASEMLTFIVVVPHWPDKRAWKALRALPSCRALVQLAQAEHGYFEGAQQYRDALWRPANHDSSLFFLMSARAHAACPVTAARERRLREAFGKPPA